jgi:aminocarboxymuconate-semialdehyde decarboxylase
MVEIIDAFAHAMPKEVVDEMIKVYPTSESRALLAAPWFWDEKARLNDMNEFGITQQVLTLARPSIWIGMDPTDALPLTRMANDKIREMAERHPDRLIPVGTLPFINKAFMGEFERCIDELHMAGIQIFSNVESKPIDSDEHQLLYKKAAKKGVPLWLHPQLHNWYDWLDTYMLNKSLGWPFDTSVAMARLVFSGIMEKYDVKIIAHHMGAMIPHFVTRLAEVYKTQVQHPELYPYEIPKLKKPIEEYFQKFYADTVRGGAPSILKTGCEFFGEDHIIFATDYPFGPERGRAFLALESQAVKDMDISEPLREKIFSKNIRSVLGSG